MLEWLEQVNESANWVVYRARSLFSIFGYWDLVHIRGPVGFSCRNRPDLRNTLGTLGKNRRQKEKHLPFRQCLPP